MVRQRGRVPKNPPDLAGWCTLWAQKFLTGYYCPDLENALNVDLAPRIRYNDSSRASTMSIVAVRQGLEVKEVARRIMLGQSTAQISTEMDISESHIRELCKTQVMADEIAELDVNMFSELDEKLRERNMTLFSSIQEVQHESFTKLVSLMRFSKDERLQTNIAMDILDRGGNAAQKIAVQRNEISLDPITAKLLVQAFTESKGKGKGTVIDVEPT